MHQYLILVKNLAFHQTNTCSKSAIEPLEKDGKYFQNWQLTFIMPFWCLCGQLWIYFTLPSRVSIVYFQQVCWLNFAFDTDVMKELESQISMIQN